MSDPVSSVSLMPHDPTWANMAETEMARMRRVLDGTALDIQHVGSTAVPGLAAKPILDIAILLPSFADAQQAVEALAPLGYAYRPNTAHHDRKFLRGLAGGLAVHVHLFEEAGFGAQVAFRDALRQDVILSAQYGALKERLARAFATDREAYTSAKASFITGALSRIGRKYAAVVTRSCFLTVLLLVCAGCTAYDENILGNRYHRVACEELPTRASAEEILHSHQDVVERIIQLRSAGSVTVDLAEPCLGRADLVIRFPSAEVRRQIEQIIGSDTFFGIPYDLVNV